MSAPFHDDDYSISISVEAPVEDLFQLYGYPSSLPVGNQGAFPKDLGNLDDLLLGPSSYASGSPLPEDSPELTYRSDSSSSWSPFSFDGLSLGSPCSFFSSTTSSPSFGVDDLADETYHATVSPKDVMGDMHTSLNVPIYDTPSAPSQWLPMEPLFDTEVDEAQIHGLVALDELPREEVPEVSPSISSTLFGAQTTGLRIQIPATTPSIRTPIPIIHSPAPSPSPALSSCLASPSPMTPFSFSPELTPPESSGNKSALSYSPASSPSVSQRVLRRSSRSSSISSCVSPRHHPYKPEISANTAGEVISQADFKLVVSFLRPFPQFEDWNFDTDGLPPMISGIVGSKKTREASENRRTTQEGGFSCFIPGCGSTITKKHNLRHHIVSHFILHAFECNFCKQGFNHQCSLVRHLKKCRVPEIKSGRAAQSAGSIKRGKRAKRS